MASVALEGLWTYIQSLNLSKRNRKWLAEKLVAPDSQMPDDTDYLESSQTMVEILKKGKEEIAQGKGEPIAVEDLWK